MKIQKSHKYSGIFTNGHFSIVTNPPQQQEILYQPFPDPYYLTLTKSKPPYVQWSPFYSGQFILPQGDRRCRQILYTNFHTSCIKWFKHASYH